MISNTFGKYTFMCAAALALLVPVGSAQAKGLTVLYSFCSQKNCPDGAGPTGPLFLDSQGNLYGTTGGDNGTSCQGGIDCGNVFILASGGAFSVLHTFVGGSSDGGDPYSGVIVDTSGNIYGTTGIGGENGAGTVFELAPNGAETILYNFCTQEFGTCGGDYGVGAGGLIMDAAGNLYGTTLYGGEDKGVGPGTVFTVAPNGTLTILYEFGSNPDGDGDGPDDSAANLIADGQGNFYGTTLYGGPENLGTVFKLAADGTETVLYNFCSQQTNCGDGGGPSAGLTMDSHGNLYGTTNYGGGVSSSCPNGCGTVFKLAPNGTETVLHAFTGGSDGSVPWGGLVADSRGNLYGATDLGGAYNSGTVFKVSPKGTETVLHSFCSKVSKKTGSCLDGERPGGGLIADGNGDLYGTTIHGGQHGLGTIFTLKE